MTSSTDLQVDLRQMIIAIETAVSLVGMNDTNHGKRVGYIAGHIGRQLGFSDAEFDFVFELGLLHDCGVSTNQMHAALVNYFDWTEASLHCEIGYRLLKDFEPLKKYAVPIRHHHTHFDQLDKFDLTPYDARLANLIFLSDRIDVLSASHYQTDILLARNEVVRTINETYSGTFFDPELVEAFNQAQRSEAFWIALEDRHIVRYAWDMGRDEHPTVLSLEQLRKLSLILAYVVDQKSPFTAEHSVGVADVAKYLASVYGLDEGTCTKVEVAGLLHDLGKLHIPDQILEKPGGLDQAERAIMNQHSYETFEILRRINGLEEISRWAAYHHEGIRDGGYPFHPQSGELSTEARIIAVADVFQALVQNRPYRAGLPLDKVTEILDEQASTGRLDPSLVALAKKHGARCFEIARGNDPLCNKEYRTLVLETAQSEQAVA